MSKIEDAQKERAVKDEISDLYNADIALFFRYRLSTMTMICVKPKLKEVILYDYSNCSFRKKQDNSEISDLMLYLLELGSSIAQIPFEE